MKNPNILISGAGIAGVTLAYWLRRHGFNPTVVERSPAVRDGGYKVDVRGAAIEVLERMGLMSEARSASTDMQLARFVDRAGKQLATMDAELFGGRESGDLELMRGDLVQLLYRATKDEIEFLFDDAISGLRETEDGVEVQFDKAATRRFDLVLGADGLHSRVRALTFGDESKLLRGLAHCISIFSVPNHLGLDRTEVMHASPGKTAGMYSTRQSRDARALFMFATPEGFNWDRRDAEQQKALLAKIFAGEGWEVPRLLEAMWDAPDFYFDSISLVRMERWSHGRVGLVGDAAYCASPASGQGTSLALVGAYVLAGEIARANGDPARAFSAYQNAMKSFVERNQQLAEGNLKGMVLKSAGQIRFQLGMLRILPYLPGRNWIVGRVARAIHQAASAITLPDYATVRAASAA